MNWEEDELLREWNEILLLLGLFIGKDEEEWVVDIGSLEEEEEEEDKDDEEVADGRKFRL